MMSLQPFSFSGCVFCRRRRCPRAANSARFFAASEARRRFLTMTSQPPHPRRVLLREPARRALFPARDRRTRERPSPPSRAAGPGRRTTFSARPAAPLAFLDGETQSLFLPVLADFGFDAFHRQRFNDAWAVLDVVLAFRCARTHARKGLGLPRAVPAPLRGRP